MSKEKVIKENKSKTEQIDFEDKKTRNTLISAFSWIGYLTLVTFLCQFFIFENNREIALSVLVGTSGSMIGAFSAMIASPYNLEDEKRLTKVGTTIATLATGYFLAKIVDPLVTHSMSDPSVFFSLIRQTKNGANVLIGLISFLGGFLAVYQFRAYLSGELFLTGESKNALKKEDGIIVKEETSIKAITVSGEKNSATDIKPEDEIEETK